jgi:hypothetical protein
VGDYAGYPHMVGEMTLWISLREISSTENLPFSQDSPDFPHRLSEPANAVSSVFHKFTGPTTATSLYNHRYLNNGIHSHDRKGAGDTYFFQIPYASGCERNGKICDFEVLCFLFLFSKQGKEV